MDSGKLVATGTPEAALTPEMIARVFGVQVRIATNASGRRHIEYLVDVMDGARG